MSNARPPNTEPRIMMRDLLDARFFDTGRRVFGGEKEGRVAGIFWEEEAGRCGVAGCTFGCGMVSAAWHPGHGTVLPYKRGATAND